MSGWWMASPSTALAVAVAAAVLLAWGLLGGRGRLAGGPALGAGGSWARRLRAAAWILAVLSGAALVLRPLGARSSTGGEAVLITDAGFAPRSGDVRSRPLFALSPAAGSVEAPADATRATALPDARLLWRRAPGLGEVEIAGHGLNAWDWNGFAGRVVFAPPALPDGVVAAAWPRRIALGERLRVAGRVVLHGGGKLVLEGPGGAEDEAQIPAGVPPDGVPFAFQALPRAAGRMSYRLRLERARNSPTAAPTAAPAAAPAAEVLDVVVEEARPAAVLVLESAPRFETRFLKDWLAERGGRVAVLSTISKDRVRTESPAGAGPALGRRLDAATLAGFDVALVDPAALAGLTPDERAALRTAVSQGLGLVIEIPRSPASGPPDALPADFGTPPTWSRLPGLDLLSARVAWPGAPALPTLDVEARELSGAGETLLRDASGRRLALRTAGPPGASSRVAWNLVDGTYRWVLEGNAVAHRAFWSHLLGAVARPRRAPEGRLRVPAGPVLVDWPVEVILTAGTPGPQEPLELRDAPPGDVPAEAQALPLAEDALDARRWTTTLWPRRAGWLRVESPAGATLDLYAAPRESWAAWRAAQRQAATLARAADPGAPAAALPPGPRRPLDRWPFFALLVLGLAWLWGEERLRG